MRQAQHIQAYVSIGELRNAEFMASGAVFQQPVKGQDDSAARGGIVLLLIFMVLIVGPVLYNKKPSRFEKQRSPLFRMDGIGITCPHLTRNSKNWPA